MAKELPYFKFEPSKWENGNIQILTREDKGLFIDLCSMYWSRLGDVPIKLAIQKLCGGNATALNPLCDENIIEFIDGNIFIKFLSEQLNEFEDTSKQNSKNAKEGWEKRRQKKQNQQVNATASSPQSETDAIREDKIKEDEIREDNILLKKETKRDLLNKKIEFDFSKSSQEFEDYFLNEFIKAPKQKKKTKELLAKILIDLQSYDEPFAIDLMKKAVLNNWQGYKFDKTDEQYADYLRKKQNGNSSQWTKGATNGISGQSRKQSFVLTESDFFTEMQAGEEN